MLAEAGYTPVTFDSFVTGWRDAALFGPVIEGDLLVPGDLARAFEACRPATVMHFAALSLAAESVADPGKYWRNNVCGTLNLLEAMGIAGVDNLVFSSTAATYGKPDVALIAESAPQSPTNPYGQTRLAVERMIGDFGRAHGLRAMIFRYFNVAGAAEGGRIGEFHRPETHLVPLILDAASGRREAITVYGADYPTPDGTCIRDHLHVEDLADAHVLGLSHLLDGGGSDTMNLGVGRGYSVARGHRPSARRHLRRYSAEVRRAPSLRLAGGLTAATLTA